MTGFRHERGKTLAGSCEDIKSLTKFVDKHKIRNSKLEELKELVLRSVRGHEAVKHTCPRFVRIERSLL